jgi:hypothetical protein
MVMRNPKFIDGDEIDSEDEIEPLDEPTDDIRIGL